MTTASTTLLGLALPVTGELSGTWGDVVNASLTNLLDTAIAGTTTLSSDADVTLSTTTLSANQARQAVILWTAGGTATRTITAPAQSKPYIVINKTSSSQSIKIVGVGPTTGVTIVAGTAALVAWNGVDFVTISVTSTTGIVPVANGGTGLASGTSGGVLAYTATGTLASSAALAASALVLGGGAGAAPATTTTGTGVVTALGVNTGSAGAFVVNGGALGSPSSAGTIPAFTLGGTVAGGGNQINNVIIGTTTPLAGAFTTLSATKPTTIGDVITFTSGAASSKTGYLYVNTTSVALSGAPNGGSGMCNISLSATGLTLYGPDQTKTAVLDNTGLAVTGTLSATGNITTNTSVGGVLSLQNTSVEKVYISGGASYNAFSLNQTGIGTTSTNLLFATSNVINMTLDTSGSLGLKVTPSGSSAGAFTQLQIGGSSGLSTFYGQSNDYACGLASGAYFNSSSQYVYASSTKAVSNIYAYNGSTKIQYAASGTAGNTFTPTTIADFTSTGLAVTGTLSASAGTFTTSSATYGTTVNNTSNAQNYNALSIFQRQGVNKASFVLDSNDNFSVYHFGAAGVVTTVSSTGLAVTGTLSSTLDATIYGLTVGRGGGAVSTNTAVGASALSSGSQSGTYNTAIGYSSLYSNTTGSYNVAFGASSLSANTTGQTNNSFGWGSLASNVAGSNNCAFGHGALNLNTASNNTAFGHNALVGNTSGTRNVAVGVQALNSNTTATQNTAIGYNALYTNTTAEYVTAVGSYALQFSNGLYNTAVGSYAMNSTTSGTDSTAVGTEALTLNTTGSYNTAVGRNSLKANTTASNNTAVGYQSLYANTTGASNTSIGYQAGYTNATGTRITMIGNGAGYNSTGNDNTFVGQNAGNAITSGAANTVIGRYNGNQGGLDIRTASNYIVLSDGDGNIVASSKTAQTFALQGGTLSAGTGIAFPATQSASTDANTLDDYEEGTWTPSIGGTATYTYQTGRYTKIGRMVYVSAIFQVNVIGTGSTSQISGLPFSGASGYVGAEASFSVSYFGSIASNVVTLYANATSASVQFYGLTAAAGSVAVISPFQNTTRIDFSGWYIAAN